MRRRLVTSTLLLALSLLLGGCRMSGTIDVRSAEQLVVDVTFVDPLFEQEVCSAGYWGNLPEELTGDFSDAGGENSCRISGTVHPEKLRQYLDLSQVGEYVSLHINPLNVAPDGEPTGGSPYYSLLYSDLDLTVTFPGRVVSATGDIDGTRVHFRDPAQFVRAYGLQATALSHAGPEWSVLGPLGGVAVGVIATLLWHLGRRRRAASLRLASQQDAEHEAVAEPSDELMIAQSPERAPEPPDDPDPSGRPASTQPNDPPATTTGRRSGPSQWAPD